MADRDLAPPPAAKLRDVAADRRVELDFSALDQQPDRGSRGHDFRQRRGIENRVVRHRLDYRNERAISVDLFVHGVAALEVEDTAGELVLGDRGLDRAIEL